MTEQQEVDFKKYRKSIIDEFNNLDISDRKKRGLMLDIERISELDFQRIKIKEQYKKFMCEMNCRRNRMISDFIKAYEEVLVQ